MHAPYHPPTGDCSSENELTEASIGGPDGLLSCFMALEHSPANAKRQNDRQEQNGSRNQQRADWARVYEDHQLIFTALKCN
jgi:hypothetical protein